MYILFQIKSKIDNAVNVVARYLNLEAKNVKLECSSQHGYTFRISLTDEKKSRKMLKEMNIVDTKNAGVRFRDVKLDQLNREYLKIASEFDTQQQYVMKEIYNITCGKCYAYICLHFSYSRFIKYVRTDIATKFTKYKYKNNFLIIGLSLTIFY